MLIIEHEIWPEARRIMITNVIIVTTRQITVDMLNVDIVVISLRATL